MRRFKVGVTLHPQHTDVSDLRSAWRKADELGVDTIWTWDHFFPLYGDRGGPHFECWTLLAAMAFDTKKARFGALVSCNSYRNPELLADMARTVDHLSGGRLILGIGAGWFRRDYNEYGYEFRDGPWRLRQLRAALPRIESRVSKLNPPPVGDLPILIGGGGERVTLRLVARHGQMWNSFGPPDKFAHKNEVLDRWCEKEGRDPNEIERTCSIDEADINNVDAFLEAGAQHLILKAAHPFDMTAVEELLTASEG